ncbi:Hypothetical protein R9X50_00536800 [Acrodontium crateriforme]|uniref:Sec20 C-terminal domain-containing protein n=1 Tax=Acrodontium crateriforme TaxID=150365 RepID=A0AAQ3RD70_9PEZI|nr:Hypothetical protein R9X50_00536800 [Acrodontium crateriforme]
MSASPLVAQLAQLSSGIKQTNSLTARLAKLPFQPGTEPLDTTDSVRLELATDIHDTLKSLEEQLELIAQQVDDLSPPPSQSSTRQRRESRSTVDRERALQSAQVARLGEDLRAARGHFRRAQLAAKRSSDAAKQKERELVFAQLQASVDNTSAADEPTEGDVRSLLFAGRKQANPRDKLSKDEQLVAASSDVTAALRRTHALLSTELSRSRFAQETFDQSTAALSELGDHYGNLTDILSNSRNLLGTLLRSQKSDTWYLETAFYILIATLCWLFFRRLLWGPFILLPRFFLRTAILIAKWTLLKPLLVFLSVTGVLTTSLAPPPEITTTRRPLIIQPSASSPPQRFPNSNMNNRAGIPVGAGGSGAKAGPPGQLSGHKSEEIARMAEKSQREAQGLKDEVRRGDGTVLQERGADERPNPKKKNFEADVEDAKQAQRQKDEL